MRTTELQQKLAKVEHLTANIGYPQYEIDLGR